MVSLDVTMDYLNLTWRQERGAATVSTKVRLNVKFPYKNFQQQII